MPSGAELAIGERFLAWMIELFAIQRVVAVGNHAVASLGRMGVEHARVRHPSQGGKRLFVEGVARLAPG
jgi:uracil-DNA glycosylase